MGTPGEVYCWGGRERSLGGLEMFLICDALDRSHLSHVTFERLNVANPK
jgi:hypothetical protein